MINYYRILDIPDYSEEELIKSAFRKQAKKYHPDLNPDQYEGGAAFRLVQEAWETLGNAHRKLWYDQRLKAAQAGKSVKLRQQARGRNADDTAKRREAFMRHAARERQKEIQQYLSSNAFFPFKRRIAVASLLGLNGLFVAYNHWFINLLSYGQFYAFCGFLLFFLSALWITSIFYRIKRYQLITEGGNQNVDQKSIRLLLLILLMGFVIVAGFSSFRKWYHLKEYPAMVVGKIIHFSPSGSIQVQYEWNGNYYEKKFNYSIPSYSRNYSILLKISRRDPRIAKVASNY